MQYYIKPGTVDGGVCHVRGEGSCDPGEEPGDIQIKISVQKHAEYSLKGSDLVCTHRVALAELLQGNLVTLLINSNLLDADSSIIHLTQLKVIHHKHIDGNAYKLIAPVSPAPKPGSVYIATGGTLPSHHSSHNARHTAFVHFRSRHAYPLLARARLPGHRNRCRLP